MDVNEVYDLLTSNDVKRQDTEKLRGNNNCFDEIEVDSKPWIAVTVPRVGKRSSVASRLLCR
jgi:hypothetical protein